MKGLFKVVLIFFAVCSPIQPASFDFVSCASWLFPCGAIDEELCSLWASLLEKMEDRCDPIRRDQRCSGQFVLVEKDRNEAAFLESFNQACIKHKKDMSGFLEHCVRRNCADPLQTNGFKMLKKAAVSGSASVFNAILSQSRLEALNGTVDEEAVNTYRLFRGDEYYYDQDPRVVLLKAALEGGSLEIVERVSEVYRLELADLLQFTVLDRRRVLLPSLLYQFPRLEQSVIIDIIKLLFNKIENKFAIRLLDHSGLFCEDDLVEIACELGAAEVKVFLKEFIARFRADQGAQAEIVLSQVPAK